MKKIIFYLILFGAFHANAQTKSIKKSPALGEGSPESVGMSKERLGRLDAVLQEAIDNSDVPGLVALVAKNGKIVFHKAYGMADEENKRPMKKDDIFRIASQSKAITATAVMMLWEEGKFQLDDPISMYIPEFKNPKVLSSFHYKDTSYTVTPANKEITIRHLLTHTSGIGYGEIDNDERMKMIYQKAGIVDLFTTENISIEENTKKLASLPLHHNPGEKFTYSEGLDVLGYFVEVISGTPFDEFLRKKLFEPLGMHDTWFYLPSEKANRLVKIHKTENGKWVPFPITFYDPDYPVKGARKFYSGGAGLSSTAKDYASFLQMYLNGGELNGVRILSRTTVQAMMANQIGDFWNGTGRHYGLAFGVITQQGQDMGGRGSIGTFDWGGYFNTQYFADPNEKVIGIIMKQTLGPVSEKTRWQYRQLIEQAIDD